MALDSEPSCSVLEKLLDTADIVRDGGIQFLEPMMVHLLKKLALDRVSRE